jgi:hypothetical protein
MLICNESCLTLGCTTTSKELILGLCAFEDGLHILEWEWLGTIHAIEIPAIKGKPFIFRNPFNESGITKFRIYQPTLGLYHDCESHFCFELYMAPGFVHSEKNSIFETLYGDCPKWTINGTRYTAIRQGDGESTPITLKICS